MSCIICAGDTPSVLTEVMADLGRLSEEVHKFAFEIVFAQLKNYLADVSTMEVCVCVWVCLCVCVCVCVCACACVCV